MTQGFSRSDLLQFLEYLGDKGLMNQQTAAARKASVGSLLGILTDEEAGDVTRLDLNQVAQRIRELEGQWLQAGEH